MAQSPRRYTLDSTNNNWQNETVLGHISHPPRPPRPRPPRSRPLPRESISIRNDTPGDHVSQPIQVRGVPGRPSKKRTLNQFDISNKRQRRLILNDFLLSEYNKRKDATTSFPHR